MVKGERNAQSGTYAVPGGEVFPVVDVLVVDDDPCSDGDDREAGDEHVQLVSRQPGSLGLWLRGRLESEYPYIRSKILVAHCRRS